MARRGVVVSCCYPGSDLALQGPEQDALAYEDVLGQLGFEHLVMLSDRRLGKESSHKSNVVREIQRMLSKAEPGDSLVFVFIGHGICVASTRGDRRDDLDRALVLAEAQTPFPQNLLFEHELQALFARVPPRTALTCILDGPCGDTVVRLPEYFDGKHGSFFRGPQRAVAMRSTIPLPGRACGYGPAFAVRGQKATGAALAVHGRAASSQGALGGCDLAPGAAVVLLSACRPGQACFETPGADGQVGGVFSRCLVELLAEHLAQGKLPTYMQLAQSLEDRVQRHLSDSGLADRGLAQNLLLGFSSRGHAEGGLFLEPAAHGAARPRGSGAPAAALSGRLEQGGSPTRSRGSSPAEYWAGDAGGTAAAVGAAAGRRGEGPQLPATTAVEEALRAVGAVPPRGPPPAKGPNALLAGAAAPMEADETLLETTLPRGAAAASAADEAVLDTALRRQPEVTDLVHGPQAVCKDGAHNRVDAAVLQHIDTYGDRSASSLLELAAALDAGQDAVPAAAACA